MKNVNADFLLDIWADLKAKKLAPVAVGLAVALVAMPALMLKGEDAPSSSPLPIAATPAASGDDAEVELAEELGDGGSKLDSYKAHDPFSGGNKPSGDTSGTSGTAIAPSDDAAPDTGGDLAKLLGGGGAPGGGPPESVPGFGQQPDSGSGGGLTTGGDTPRVQRTNFTYELDVKFGRPGREKRYRHLSRMSFLPNAKVPAMMFMGVPVGAKSAIFFVHPSLSHAGEGTCTPSPQNCNFLELPIGRDHFLSVNDYEFRIHLLGIHRVKLDENATQQRQTSGSSRSDRGMGEGTLGRGDGAGDYDVPMIADGIG
jgi:hypothetical protein